MECDLRCWTLLEPFLAPKTNISNLCLFLSPLFDSCGSWYCSTCINKVILWFNWINTTCCLWKCCSKTKTTATNTLKKVHRNCVSVFMIFSFFASTFVVTLAFSIQFLSSRIIGVDIVSRSTHPPNCCLVLFCIVLNFVVFAVFVFHLFFFFGCCFRFSSVFIYI